jgi:moderate conductance mechanosensitive channel
LKSVTDYSRDYNIEKIDVRVPFDTNVDQVRKIVKKINKELTEDVELGGKLLAPIKSQGVREVDDSAMIIRIKFKTRPGDQYAIKREIFSKLQGMFEDKGIQFAHRHVIVRFPEDTVLRGQDGREDGQHESSLTPGEQFLASGAAAAVATALAEEEAKRRKLEEAKETG